MSRSERLLQAERTRKELDEWMSRFDLEIRLGSPPRHLDPLGVLCGLLLGRLEELTGATVETTAYSAKVEGLLSRAIALWKRPAAPVVRLVQ